MFIFTSSVSVPLACMIVTIAARARLPARTVAIIAKTLAYKKRRMRPSPDSTALVSQVVRLTRFAGIVADGRSDAYPYLRRRLTDA
jgi:hypothetical protein